MDQTEINRWSTRIAAANNVDEWNRIERELRRHPEAGSRQVHELLRMIERAAAPFVANTVFRVMRQDAAAMNGNENLPYEPPAQYEPWRGEEDFVNPFAPPPGRLKEFSERLRAQGRSGLKFSFADLMDDAEMNAAVRETETAHALLMQTQVAYQAAQELEGGHQFNRYRLAIEQSDDATERRRIFEEAIADNALTPPELDALTEIFRWQDEGAVALEEWEANADTGNLMQEVEDILGTQRMQDIARRIGTGNPQDIMLVQMEIMGALQVAQARRAAERR